MYDTCSSLLIVCFNYFTYGNSNYQFYVHQLSIIHNFVKKHSELSHVVNNWIESISVKINFNEIRVGFYVGVMAGLNVVNKVMEKVIKVGITFEAKLIDAVTISINYKFHHWTTE